MPVRKVSKTELQERQEAIDTLDTIGIRPCHIFTELKEKYYENREYADTFETFWNDLKTVRKGRRELLFDGKKDLALQNLVARLQDVYSRALLDKSWGHAIDAQLHIAKARGVDLSTAGLKARLTVEKFSDVEDKITQEQATRIDTFLRGLSDELDGRPALPESYDKEP